jgi:hypothetical protein
LSATSSALVLAALVLLLIPTVVLVLLAIDLHPATIPTVRLSAINHCIQRQ